MPRRVVLFIHSTLNGVVTGDPSGDKTDFSAWTRPANLVGEVSESLVRLFERVDTILLGRATYDDLVRKWPAMHGPPGADDVVSRLATKMNGADKLVATRQRQLIHLPWGRFTPAEPLAADDVTDRLRELTAEEGGDIVIIGSPTLVRSAVDNSLIDEFHIVVHPVIVPVGARLLDGIAERADLHLEGVTALGEGAVLVSYSRAEPDGGHVTPAA